MFSHLSALLLMESFENHSFEWTVLQSSSDIIIIIIIIIIVMSTDA